MYFDICSVYLSESLPVYGELDFRRGPDVQMDIMESGRVVSYRRGFIAACPAEVIRSTAYVQESRETLDDLGG